MVLLCILPGCSSPTSFDSPSNPTYPPAICQDHGGFGPYRLAAQQAEVDPPASTTMNLNEQINMARLQHNENQRSIQEQKNQRFANIDIIRQQNNIITKLKRDELRAKRISDLNTSTMKTVAKKDTKNVAKKDTKKVVKNGDKKVVKTTVEAENTVHNNTERDDLYGIYDNTEPEWSYVDRKQGNANDTKYNIICEYVDMRGIQCSSTIPIETETRQCPRHTCIHTGIWNQPCIQMVIRDTQYCTAHQLYIQLTNTTVPEEKVERSNEVKSFKPFSIKKKP